MSDQDVEVCVVVSDFAVEVTDSVVWESAGLLCSGCCSSPENHVPPSLCGILCVRLFLFLCHSHTQKCTHSHTEFACLSLLISLVLSAIHKAVQCFSWTHFSACSGLAAPSPSPFPSVQTCHHLLWSVFLLPDTTIIYGNRIGLEKIESE